MEVSKFAKITTHVEVKVLPTVLIVLYYFKRKYLTDKSEVAWSNPTAVTPERDVQFIESFTVNITFFLVHVSLTYKEFQIENS